MAVYFPVTSRINQTFGVTLLFSRGTLPLVVSAPRVRDVRAAGKRHRCYLTDRKRPSQKRFLRSRRAHTVVSREAVCGRADKHYYSRSPAEFLSARPRKKRSRRLIKISRHRINSPVAILNLPPRWNKSSPSARLISPRALCRISQGSPPSCNARKMIRIRECRRLQ